MEKEYRRETGAKVGEMRERGATSQEVKAYVRKRTTKGGRREKRKEWKRRALAKLEILKKHRERRVGPYKKAVKGGTWNTRGWGGRYARIDPYLKAECLFRLANIRGWQFCLFTDLKYPENGVREYTTGGGKWTMVVQGKVGIALIQKWTDWWRESGAKTWYPGTAGNRENRELAIQLNRKGWRKGLFRGGICAGIGDQKEGHGGEGEVWT